MSGSLGIGSLLTTKNQASAYACFVIANRFAIQLLRKPIQGARQNGVAIRLLILWGGVLLSGYRFAPHDEKTRRALTRVSSLRTVLPSNLKANPYRAQGKTVWQSAFAFVGKASGSLGIGSLLTTKNQASAYACFVIANRFAIQHLTSPSRAQGKTVWQSAFAFVGKASGSLDIGSQASGNEKLAILNAVKNPSFKEGPLLTFKMTKLTGRFQRCARATKNRILQVPQQSQQQG